MGKEIRTFPKGIMPEINVVARLMFELVSYDFTVQYVYPFAIGTSLSYSPVQSSVQNVYMRMIYIFSS